jgi:hypothetical protein
MFGVVDIVHAVEEEVLHRLHVCGKPTHGAPPCELSQALSCASGEGSWKSS